MSGMYFLNDWEEDIIGELRQARRDWNNGRYLDAEQHQESARQAVMALDTNEADSAERTTR